MHLKFIFILLLPINSSHSSRIKFDKKLEKAETPELLLLKLLAHPDHSVLPADESFASKPALFLAIRDFAHSDEDQHNRVVELVERLIEKWELGTPGDDENSDQQNDQRIRWSKFQSILKAIQGMCEDGQVEEKERVKLLLLALYQLGKNELGAIIESGELLECEDDKYFVNALKGNFHKIIRLVSGINEPNSNIFVEMVGIGQKLNENYNKSVGEEPLTEEMIRLGSFVDLDGHKIENYGLAAKLFCQAIDEVKAQGSD